VRARFFRDVVERRTVRLIVIHTTESPETPNAAESVARFFQNPGRQVSAHLCIDNDSIVRSA
jgi:N-acetylmuramoyl-L-alanine amidase CwlA